MVEKQMVLEKKRIIAAKKEIDVVQRRVRRLAAELHQVYKRYKAGLVKEEDLTDEQKRLFRKYYGVR